MITNRRKQTMRSMQRYGPRTRRRAEEDDGEEDRGAGRVEAKGRGKARGEG